MKFPKPSRIILYALLAFLAFLLFLPMWSCITTSFKTGMEVALGRPLIFSSSPTLEPYVSSFNILKRPLLNSFIFTTGAMILSCFIGSITGYILCKMRFRGDNAVFLLLIFGAFLPYQAVLIPLMVTVSKLGLYNSVWGLMLVHTAYGIPICTLLFRHFYGYIPNSLINSAKVDGAGDWTIYRRIVLPLSILPFVVAGVFQFTSIWNDYLFGLVLTMSPDKMPATVALANLKGTYAALWNRQMAGAIWVALPVLIIYFVLGKYIIYGYMAGAVKG